MPKNFVLHTTLLIFAALGVYLWLSLELLRPFTLQLVALLILVYAAHHWYKPKRRKSLTQTTVPLDLTLLTTMLLLLVTETGALDSPFFFFFYFLLFAVALLYEIEATLVLTGTLVIFFLVLPVTDLGSIAHLSELAALIFVTPLALYAGHQREALFIEKQKSLALTANLAQEETDTLTFLSLNLKSTLLSALDNLSLIIPKTQVKEVRNNLHVLYQDLRHLYRSADELQQLIDRETDKS